MKYQKIEQALDPYDIRFVPLTDETYFVQGYQDHSELTLYREAKQLQSFERRGIEQIVNQELEKNEEITFQEILEEYRKKPQ